MTKFLNKWLRKAHRWISLPTFLSIPIMLFVRATKGAYFTVSPQFEAVQQILIFLLALSGAYLYFIPYIMKSRRKAKRQSTNAE